MMKRKLILLALLILLLLIKNSLQKLLNNNQTLKCPLVSQKSQFLKEQFQLSSQTIENDQQNIKKCLNKAVKLGQFLLVDHIIQKYRKQSNFNLYINSVLVEQLKRLKELSKWIIYQQSICQPRVKWAQNQTHIFLTIKLSHRWDSPPCLNILSQNIVLSNQSIEYQNQCIVSNNKIHFKKLIQLKKQVKADTLQSRKDGIGTYYIQFQKLITDDIWTCLDSQNTNYLIWNQIAETYESAFNKFKDLRQQLRIFQK